MKKNKRKIQSPLWSFNFENQKNCWNDQFQRKKNLVVPPDSGLDRGPWLLTSCPDWATHLLKHQPRLPITPSPIAYIWGTSPLHHHGCGEIAQPASNDFACTTLWMFTGPSLTHQEWHSLWKPSFSIRWAALFSKRWICWKLYDVNSVTNNLTSQINMRMSGISVTVDFIFVIASRESPLNSTLRKSISFANQIASRQAQVSTTNRVGTCGFEKQAAPKQPTVISRLTAPTSI